MIVVSLEIDNTGVPFPIRDWVPVALDPAANLSITYSETLKLFVRGSSSSDGLYYSSNGRDWSISNILSKDYVIKSIIWVEGWSVFITFSEDRVIYSSNGITWTEYDNGVDLGALKSPSQIVYYENLNKVFCVADGGKVFFINEDYTSSGLETIPSSFSTNNFSGVATDGKIIIATSTNASALLFSADGINWRSITVNVGYSIGYSSTLKSWCFGSNNRVYYSLNGVDWIEGVIGNGYWGCINEYNGLFLLGSVSQASNDNILAYSLDGINFNIIYENEIGDVRDIAYSEFLGVYVTAGTDSDENTLISLRDKNGDVF